MTGGNGALLPVLCEDEEDYAFEKKIVDFYIYVYNMTGNSEVTDMSKRMVWVMGHYFRFLVENSFRFGMFSFSSLKWIIHDYRAPIEPYYNLQLIV